MGPYGSNMGQKGDHPSQKDDHLNGLLRAWKRINMDDGGAHFENAALGYTGASIYVTNTTQMYMVWIFALPSLQHVIHSSTWSVQP